MGKINDDSLYPIKQTLSSGDTVIGSDGSTDNEETVQFPASLFGSPTTTLQDNKFKDIKLGVLFASDNNITSLDPASRINSLNPSITVSDDEVVVFTSIAFVTGLPIQYVIWAVRAKGKGTYGSGGDTTVTNSEIFELSRTTVSWFPDDQTSDVNANLVDFGEVADGDFVNAINTSPDTYVITAGTNWYFEGTVSGNRILYGWQGANGTYGNGGTTAVASDIFLIFDETEPPVTVATGLEKVDSTLNGNVGWRFVNKPAGDIGNHAVDFGDEGDAATGNYAVNFGISNWSRGLHGFVNGNAVIATDPYGFSHGRANFNLQPYNFVSGEGVKGDGDSATTGHNFVSGKNINLTESTGCFVRGTAIEGTQLVGCTILGAANKEIASSGGFGATDPIFILGNGSHSLDLGLDWSLSAARSNAIEVYRAGEILAPSLTTAMIDSEVTGKVLVTKEYLETTYTASVISYLDEGNGFGYRFTAADAVHRTNIGENAIDFSFSNGGEDQYGPSANYAATISGLNVVASGGYSLVLGGLINTASNTHAMVLNGQSNTASGSYSTVLNSNASAATAQNAMVLSGGQSNATALYSTVLNSFRGRTNGDYSTVIGNRDNTAYSYGETVLGTYATDYAANLTTGISTLDRLLTIGYGTSALSRADALTILKNGNMAIGIDQFQSNDTGEKLQVNGKVRTSTIKATSLGTYADDAAAGVGGLTAGDLYQTATGEIRIKL